MEGRQTLKIIGIWPSGRAINSFISLPEGLSPIPLFHCVEPRSSDAGYLKAL